MNPFWELFLIILGPQRKRVGGSKKLDIGTALH